MNNKKLRIKETIKMEWANGNQILGLDENKEMIEVPSFDIKITDEDLINFLQDEKNWQGSFIVSTLSLKGEKGLQGQVYEGVVGYGIAGMIPTSFRCEIDGLWLRQPIITLPLGINEGGTGNSKFKNNECIIFNGSSNSFESYTGIVYFDSVKTKVFKVKNHYILSESDDVVLVDAGEKALEIRLPDASINKGKSFQIKKIDTSINTIKIKGIKNQLIDGNNEITITEQWLRLKLISDSENWFVIS